MVAAGFRYPAQPCAAAVADPSFANVALRMRAQSWSKLVNDGRAFRPFAGRTEDHRAVLELRAHRCARQRVVLTLP